MATYEFFKKSDFKLLNDLRIIIKLSNFTIYIIQFLDFR